jgi:thioredoxin 1
MLPSLSNLEQIAAAIDEAKTAKKLLLLKFGAKWCKPCKNIAPVVQGMVESNSKHVNGFEVDVDEVAESLTQFNVSSLPTFLLILDGNVVTTWIGADNQVLEENLFTQIDKLPK